MKSKEYYYNQIKIWTDRAMTNLEYGQEPETHTLDAIQTYINKLKKID